MREKPLSHIYLLVDLLLDLFQYQALHKTLSISRSFTVFVNITIQTTPFINARLIGYYPLMPVVNAKNEIAGIMTMTDFIRYLDTQY